MKALLTPGGTTHVLFARKHYAEWLKIYAEASTASPPELMDNAKEELLYDHGQVEFSLKHWPQAVAAFDA